MYVRGNRAIQVDYRRDGAVNSAQYYHDYRVRQSVWALKNKKEAVLAWLAE